MDTSLSPVGCGGLGVRQTGQLALAAAQASAYSVHVLMDDICDPNFDIHVQEAELQWMDQTIGVTKLSFMGIQRF